jgi:DNA-binding NtrC family response regulator
MKIFVLEDDADFRDSLVRLLRCLGHRVEHTDKAADARVRLNDAGDFDAAITDFGLGDGETGLVFLEWLRGQFPAVRRILISGLDQADVPAVDGPVQAFLRKPFGHTQLLDALQDSVSRRTAPQEEKQ